MFKTTKAKVIFVIIFCAICISVTLGLILYKNIEIEQEFSEDTNALSEDSEKQKDIAGIDLNGTYNQNDLRIEEKRVAKEKVEISYCQIYGLKDKIIQDNINKELENVALNFYREKIKDLDEVINVSVNMMNTGNFANAISFEISYVAKIDDDADGFYQDSKGLNYNLRTGEKITIDKLFTSDAPMEDILRKSAYYSLIQNNLEDNLSGDFVVADYGDIEDDIAIFINQYKKGKIKGFYFTPKCIYIYYDETSIISIDMKEYADYIAIYNRYLTDETIFETNNIGLKNLYTLSERYTVDYRYTNYEKGSNYFIDINIDNVDGEENKFSQQVLQNKIKEIESEIERIKVIANKNTSEFYILNYYMYICTIEENSTQQILTYCQSTGDSYEMTLHDFEENIEPVIIEVNRADPGGALPDYIYNFGDILKVEPQEIREYYNPETGEKVVI